jgi:putative CocE/NonD family hydrolase
VSRALRLLAPVLAGVALGAAPAGAAAAAAPPYGEAVERDVAIRMRDGVVLRADVYRPARPDGTPAPGPFPVLVSETPYGKEAGTAGLDIASGHRPYLVRRGYVQVIVDVRGQGGSQGSFQLLGPDEQADSREVVLWASRLPGTTGEVGMTGESYLGIVQLFAAAAMGPGSPLKAIFPIVTPADPYRDLTFSGGLLNIESDAALVAAYGALQVFSPLAQAAVNPAAGASLPAVLPDRVADVLRGFSAATITDVLAGGDRAYDQAYWGDHRKPVDVAAQVVANGIPAYLVAGSFDVFQRGTPLLFAALQNAWAGRRATAPMAPRQKVTGRYQLLVKPEYHTTVDAGEPDLDELQLRWFDRWLKHRDTGIERTSTPVHLVEPDGTRREASRYPLDQAPPRTFFLGDGGALTRRPPTAAGGADVLAFTGATLPCDRSTEQWALGALELALRPFGLGDPCAGQDLVPASIGPGQLTYTTPAFAADRVLAGPIAGRLYATSTARDTAWVVKLSDVAPGGRSVDQTQGALLGSHRALDGRRTWRGPRGLPLVPYHPHTKAAKRAVPPGRVVRYDVEVRPAFTTIRKGHRLRLTLLSSQSPHLLPLPEDLLALAGGVARVQRTPAAPSSLLVPLAVPSRLPVSPPGGPAAS